MLEEAVNTALDAMAADARDQAAAALARSYAAAIDCGDADLDRAGPLLLAALEALRLTPRARAQIMRGGSDDRPGGSLDELRERRARKSHPPTVDTPAAEPDA